MDAARFRCPETGGRLDPGSWTSGDGRTWPLLDGVPVLVPDPHAFLARHHPGWSVADPLPAQPAEPLPVDAPDLVTPFLDPVDLEAPGAFGRWVHGLGSRSPGRVCADWASAHAPAGDAVDLGCGVGPMTARMLQAGRSVIALDRSPRAVLSARAVVERRLEALSVPTHRRGFRRVRNPVEVPAGADVCWVVGDALAPPLAPAAFAWVHLGNLLDMVGEGSDAVLTEAAALLVPGGLLTLSTPWDVSPAGTPEAPLPEHRLHALLDDEGLEILDEDPAVPWVVREYDRGYRVLFSHCVAARRAPEPATAS